MKILQLMGHGGVGGTETFVISLVHGLNQRGHDVTLVNTWTDSPLNAAAESAGIPFVALPGGKRRIGLRWYGLVRRYLRENTFDVVQAYGLRVSLGLRLMQKKVGVRHHVMGVRGLDQQRTGWQGWLDRRTEHLVDRVVCNAQAVAERRIEAVGTPSWRLRVIPNGIDLSMFSPGEPVLERAKLGLPDGFLIAMVASFRAEKDHGNLLEAIRLGGASLADAKFALIGDGKLKDNVASEVQRLGLTDRVMFAGAVSDVRPYLRSCDAFVLSSYSEGMPRAVMEAMALGRPVVSTRAGGVAEVANDGEHALLVPTRSPQALADALKRIVHDSDLGERLGRAAAERIRREFSREKMLDRHEELYESILQESSGH